MINAVIELGERRVHEVMVPRIAIVALPGLGRRSTRPSTTIVERGPQPDPGLRGHRSTRSSASSTPRTCCRSCKRLGGPRPDAALAAADAGVRARVDDDRRPAPRVPAAQGPHRDRPRRVRRHGRPRDDRGPARGDRRRDPGRVRRRGADGRPALRGRGAGRRPGRRSTTSPSCSTSSLGLEDEDEYDTVGGLVYHRIGGVPSPGDRIDVDGLHADGRVDRRPAGRQGAGRPRGATRTASCADEDGDR